MHWFITELIGCLLLLWRTRINSSSSISSSSFPTMVPARTRTLSHRTKCSSMAAAPHNDTTGNWHEVIFIASHQLQTLVDPCIPCRTRMPTPPRLTTVWFCGLPFNEVASVREKYRTAFIQVREYEVWWHRGTVVGAVWMWPILTGS